MIERIQAAYMRRKWALGDGERDKGLMAPRDVDATKDLAYGTSAFHTFDIYRPKNQFQEWLPTILNVHGGGWFYGDKELYRFYCMELAKHGFAVVNCNYRLAPKASFPAPLLDVGELICHLVQHQEQYYLNLDHFFMVGDSAGAQIVSEYCIGETNEEYGTLYGGSRTGLLPEAVALNCGIYEMKESFKEPYKDWYAPRKGSESLEEAFSNPLAYLNEQFPDTFLMCSANDELGIHTAPMKHRLEEVGIHHQYREYGQGSPLDGHVFHLNMRSENGALCNQEEMEFFKRYCK